MPSIRAVTGWIVANQEFAELYVAARRAQALLWADDVITLSDQAIGLDSMAQVQGLKLATDNRRWMLSRLLPHEFGDRVEHQHAHLNARVVVTLPAKGSDPGAHARLLEVLPDDEEPA
jgi:hypothetical protein